MNSMKSNVSIKDVEALPLGTGIVTFDGLLWQANSEIDGKKIWTNTQDGHEHGVTSEELSDFGSLKVVHVPWPTTQRTAIERADDAVQYLRLLNVPTQRYNCTCKVGGQDSMSIDTDWIVALGETISAGWSTLRQQINPSACDVARILVESGVRGRRDAVDRAADRLSRHIAGDDQL